jgi:hypothetical protein
MGRRHRSGVTVDPAFRSKVEEVAVYGLTGEVVAPVSKGAALAVMSDAGRYTVEAID